LALAEGDALALDGRAGVVQILDDLAGGAVVGLEQFPEVGARLEQAPLGLLHQGHRVLGRAADRFAAVERRALPAAVVARDRRAEALIEAREVFRFCGHARLLLYPPSRGGNRRRESRVVKRCMRRAKLVLRSAHTT